MSTRGHRNFLSGLVSWIFGAPIFRHRALRWPLAALLTALGVHAITVQGIAEEADRGVLVPVLFFMLAFFLMVLPFLPLADSWDERDRNR
ncbi:MAG: hypothetical protein WA989_02250 [Henriciella sp.]|uniref:hypothetical protein n=1 Tax=Henriciella sp. TaxID=1968823 RepID=UPI003C785DF9